MVTRRPATGSTSGADQRDETTLHRTGVAGVATPPAAPAPLTKRSARAFPAASFFCFVFFSHFLFVHRFYRTICSHLYSILSSQSSNLLSSNFTELSGSKLSG